MTMNSSLKAREFARWAHRGQFRRNGITPYFNHVDSVAFRIVRSKPSLFETVEVAYLHDVLEDCAVQGYTAESLRAAGFSEAVIDAVVAITKIENEAYMSYLERVKRNPLARAVKIYDIIDNLSDAPTERQLKKYSVALAYLV